MNDKPFSTFVDTNIFIYALDELEKAKSEVALDLIMQLHTNHNLTVSNQVVREFFNVFCKPGRGLSEHDYTLFAEQVLEPNCKTIENYGFLSSALVLREAHGVSYYDSLILQAAMDAGCTTLYSEDFQHGRMYDTVKVINPFV